MPLYIQHTKFNMHTCAAFRRFYNQEGGLNGGLICNGTFYRDGFSSDVIDILETARLTGTRLCIYFGNLETGEIWDGLPGYVGRSTGRKKVPLLVYNKRSLGGEEIMPAILRITTSKGVRVLYTHDNHTNQ